MNLSLPPPTRGGRLRSTLAAAVRIPIVWWNRLAWRERLGAGGARLAPETKIAYLITEL